MLSNQNKNIEYFECSSALPLKIQTNGKNTLKIINRLEFTESMGQQESYRIRVKEGAKGFGVHIILTVKGHLLLKLLEKILLFPENGDLVKLKYQMEIILTQLKFLIREKLF